MAQYQLQEDIEEGRFKFPPPLPNSIHWPPQLALGPVIFVKSVCIDDYTRVETFGLFIRAGAKATCIALNKTDSKVSNLEAVVRLEDGLIVTVDSTSLRIYHEAF